MYTGNNNNNYPMIMHAHTLPTRSYILPTYLSTITYVICAFWIYYSLCALNASQLDLFIVLCCARTVLGLEIGVGVGVDLGLGLYCRSFICILSYMRL